MNRSWILIIIAVLFEVTWVIGFKHAYNFLTWGGTIVALVLSFSLIIFASTKLPVGTVYAVFTGLGTAGTVISEMLFFNEPVNIIKLLLIALLLTGVLGLKLVGSSTKPKEVNA